MLRRAGRAAVPSAMSVPAGLVAARLIVGFVPAGLVPAGLVLGVLAAPASARADPAAPSAQPSAPPPAEDDDPTPTPAVSEVTVTARRVAPPQPGAVVGDIKPEIQFSPSDIQSFGVSTVTELLNELAPETRSDRGRGGETPVVLLNGRRISALNEIRNIPTEAILRVDILPEEVSLKYGYSADQRVVNIVLRRRFRAITGELQGGGPTEGGEKTGQAEADLLHIRGDNRLNLDLKYQGASHITDAARDIIEPQPGVPYDLAGNVVSTTPGGQIDPALSALVGRAVTIAGVPAGAGSRALTLGDFAPSAGVANLTDVAGDRTLSPATQSVTANAVLARPVPGGINATFNGTVGATSSDSLQGLPGIGLTVPAADPFSPFASPVVVDRYVAAPLRQSLDGVTAHLGSTLNRDLSDWRLSLTDAYDLALSQTDTDTGVSPTPLQSLLNVFSSSADPFGPLPGALTPALAQRTARSTSNTANVQLLANGPLFGLPAGPLYASVKAGDTQTWLNSSSSLFQAVDLTRNDANAQVNLDLPVASRDHRVLPLLGDLSINLNAAIDQVSDYGALKAFGYGVNWTPFPGYNLIVSHTNDQAAPTILQLGGPIVQTPNVSVFDYATGQAVEASVISGGAPGLSADNRNVFKAALTLKPFPAADFTLTANYIKSDIDHPVETFPAADAVIQAAFPDRFVRDENGDLIEEDERPINFARSERQELRWGFNYSRPIGPQPPPRFRRGLFGGDQGARRDRSATSGRSGSDHDRSSQNASGQEGSGQNGSGQNGSAPSGGQDAAPGSGSSNAPGGGGGGGGGDRTGGGFGGGGGAGGGGGRGGGRGFGGGFGAGGRFQIAVYHTVYFVDRMLVAPGGPTLDLLNGQAASSTGGQYRNEVEGQLGATLFGFGGRISADWRSATFVQGGAGSSTGTLFFSDITTINLRLFDNLGQQPPVVKRYPWLRGSRVTLNITNLFDQRVTVRDGSGVTPLSYQPGYIDPVGRAITLSVRKLFF